MASVIWNIYKIMAFHSPNTHLKLPNFPAQKHIYDIYTQVNMETHGTREGLSKNKGWSLVGSMDHRIIQISPPQRVVWLHHHSLANWDSNIRSSSEFDHNGLEIEARTGQLDAFWAKKYWVGGRRIMNTNKQK